MVAWFGAVQAQEYPAARWALGLRARGLTDRQVAHAFDAGEILRTHAMRPTWHFVARADIRWLQMLTGPRVQTLNAYYARKNELDAKTVARSREVIERTLAGGHQRTRTELAAALGKAGIRAEGQRLAYLMMSAELDQVICSGPRRGKQFTYALLEERAPKASLLPRDEALRELTRRYFTSHGPATLRDYVWWSGLTMADARRGVEIAGRALVRETFGELTCWSGASTPAFTLRSLGGGGTRKRSSAHLLPIYDEYLIAYKDRSAGDRSRIHQAVGRDHRRLRALARRRWPVRRDVETRRDHGRRRGQRDAPPFADGGRQEGDCGCRQPVRRVSRNAGRRAWARGRHTMKARWAWLFMALLGGLGSSADSQTVGTRHVVIGYLFPQNQLLDPAQIAAGKLTHINYAFANLHDGQVVEGFARDAENFAVLGAVRRSHPHLKLLVSVGGWTWSKGFSDAVLTPERRQRFVESAVAFVRRHDLDGFDVDWEYPVCPATATRTGRKTRPILPP